MSTATPPGWYPDPGNTGHPPATERWWDGAAWTDHTRTAGAVPAAPAQNWQPGFAPQSPPGRDRGPLVAGVVASVAVVLAIVVGVVVITRDGGPADRADGPAPSASADTTPPEDPGASGAPDGDAPRAPGSRQLTMARGVRLPLPDGWQRVPGTSGAAVHTTSYTCPLKKERCVRAGASVYVTPADGDPEEVAGADVEANAEYSYGAAYYGGITSHRETVSKPVRVAGQDGYLVRWRIDNKADPDAYVQSVAFPHPDGSGQMLVLRMGVDIHQDAPPVRVLDEIVSGVERGAVPEDPDSEAV